MRLQCFLMNPLKDIRNRQYNQYFSGRFRRLMPIAATRQSEILSVSLASGMLATKKPRQQTRLFSAKAKSIKILLI
jgi:hypothetical protein